MLPVIAAPRAIGALVLRGRAALDHWSQQRRARCGYGRQTVAPGLTLGAVGAAVPAKTARAEIVARLGAFPTAAALLFGGGAALGDGPVAEVGRGIAVGVVVAVGADWAASGLALFVNEAVGALVAALVFVADVDACSINMLPEVKSGMAENHRGFRLGLTAVMAITASTIALGQRDRTIDKVPWHKVLGRQWQGSVPLRGGGHDHGEAEGTR